MPVQIIKSGDDRLLAIPRGHPLVVRMQKRLQEDPRNIYPVLCALLGGFDGYGLRKQALQEALLGNG